MQKVPRLIEQFTPDHYDLSLDIDRHSRTFTGTVTINGVTNTGARAITLHSKELTIDTVVVDGKQATFHETQDDALVINEDNVAAGKHVVVVGFHGNISDSMHGMYPCKFRHDGKLKELIATQFESHHAREVFPCIDEPEAKATFDLTLSTEPNITVLSNLHPISQETEDDRLVTRFATTPRMSTYLLAWVYGELHKKTQHTADGTEVNIWATPAQSTESLDFALEHAVKTIEYFNEYFGVPYPLPKSDHVALPDFSSGAMENWGLITYREVALLADPKTTTVASKQYIATVISHELSHQWFGNLVTMRWWNNLWLNESFATLMEYLAVDAIHPEWNAWLDFASNESILALRRDAIDGVQSVQVDVDHPDEIASLFDGAIVYAKGARLMRMLQNYIGHDAFQHGLQSYFKEFAYSNTEADDLWRHLSAASGKDISMFMNTWISQSGYPVVEVKPDGLRQEQFFIGPHEKSDQIWPIPLNAESNEDIPELLETRELKLPVADDERLNVADTAHFLTHYSSKHLHKILGNASLTELDRLQLLHEQTLLVRGGRVPSVDLIDLLEHYRDEQSEHVWGIMALAFSELKKFVETDEAAETKLREFGGSLAEQQHSRLGWSPQVGESESDTKLRSTILSLMVYSQRPDILDHVDSLFENGVQNIDPEIRSLIISSVVYRSTDTRTVHMLLDMYRETSSADLQQDICAGLSSAQTPKHIALILDTFTDGNTIRAQDLFRWFVYCMRNRYARQSAWEWMKSNWDWIEKTYGGDKSYSDFPRYAASGLMTPEQRNDYADFFGPKRNQTALKRTIDLGIVEIDGRVELLGRDGDAVREKLRNR